MNAQLRLIPVNIVKPLVLLILVCLIMSAAHSNPAESGVRLLKEQMARMAQELQAADRAGVIAFMQHYLLAEDLESLIEDDGMTALVDGFMGQRKTDLTRYLIYASSLTPRIENNGTTFIFSSELIQVAGASRDLVFVYSPERQRFLIRN